MTKIEELEHALATAKAVVDHIAEKLHEAIQDPINNVFTTLEKARVVLSRRMKQEAMDACEGSHCMGMEQYTQIFYVDDGAGPIEKYIATANIEYNRHDKTYYYVDSFEFSVDSLTFGSSDAVSSIHYPGSTQPLKFTN